MAQITAKDVAALRAKTGLGMMDCKKALVEADGDIEQAVKILREKGLATAEDIARTSRGIQDIVRKGLTVEDMEAFYRITETMCRNFKENETKE